MNNHGNTPAGEEKFFVLNELQEMEAFDNLSPAMRDALNYAIRPFSAVQMVAAMQHGYSEAALIKGIKNAISGSCQKDRSEV